MKRRLHNAEKVKEPGPVKAKQRQKFKLADRVVVQNPLIKEWDVHGVITEVLSSRRYKVQAENDRKYMRNRVYIHTSTRDPAQLQHLYHHQQPHLYQQ